MNLRRGLLRLWMALALTWIAGAAWLLRGDLMGDCDHLLRASDLNIRLDCDLGKITPWNDYSKDLPSVPRLLSVQIIAAEWVLLPPLGSLVIGCVGFWIARGFRPST
jgi:hypothetical protein